MPLEWSELNLSEFDNGMPQEFFVAATIGAGGLEIAPAKLFPCQSMCFVFLNHGLWMCTYV